MAAIGLLADSHGDLEALDAGIQLLKERGAKRFLFTGGRYADVDAWATWKKQQAQLKTDYSNEDFLEDVSSHLMGAPSKDRPPAFGAVYEFIRAVDELTEIKKRVVRTPEKGSLSYQDPNIPKKSVDMVADVLCTIVHDRNDLIKEDLQNALVFIHGKESEPSVVQIGPRYFLCPGPIGETSHPTCGMLEWTERQVRFSAYSLDGKQVLSPQLLQVGTKSKVSII